MVEKVSELTSLEEARPMWLSVLSFGDREHRNAFAALLAVVAFGAATVFIGLDFAHRESLAIERKGEVGQLVAQFDKLLPATASDIFQIANWPAVRRYLESEQDADREELAQYFVLAVRGNPSIGSISF